MIEKKVQPSDLSHYESSQISLQEYYKLFLRRYMEQYLIDYINDFV